MPRVSVEAIARNRVSARERYRRDRKRQAKFKREERARRYEERPFIGWDSEGYDYFIAHADGTVEVGMQRTMLFGCSVPGRYIVGMELSTREMLQLILDVEADFPDAFHVGFAFEYDINQMLRDLPWRMLAVLKQTGKVRWNGYRIAHVPHKLFTVSKDGTSATIYDVFGFFHSKYTTALRKYDVGDAAINAVIARGKAKRGAFTWADIDEVVTYWKAEISLLPDLMEHIRTAAYGGGFRIGSWHGPGALASFALKYNGVLQYRSKNVPGYVKEAIRLAYAGGRFQAWQCGFRDSAVYTLDKNSAYVQGICELPRLDNGKWQRTNPRNIHGPDDIARFGLYHIVYSNMDRERGRARRHKGYPERPYPLFHRDKNGKLTWPCQVDGWFWSPEARIVAGDPNAQFLESYVYGDDGTHPFKWVSDSYDTRQHLQQIGNPAEKAYKWALASIYGAFARRVGWDRRKRLAPRTHELAWAGYITSHCRAAIYQVAAWAYKHGGLVSVDTDGVTSTVPFPEDIVPEGFGDKLGQWKQEEFSGLLYWQNGIYWLRDKNGKEWSEAKSRGVPKGVIPIQAAFDALERASFKPPYNAPRIKVKKNRYVGYRQALAGQFKRWRVWSQESSELLFGGAGKGTHVPAFCGACKKQTDKLMHTITHLPPRDMVSVGHKLPWLEELPDDMTIGDIDIRNFMERDDSIFADNDLEDNL